MLNPDFRMDATAEDLIDVVEGDRVYIPCIYVLNKIDQISIQVSLKWHGLHSWSKSICNDGTVRCLCGGCTVPRSSALVKDFKEVV